MGCVHSKQTTAILPHSKGVLVFRHGDVLAVVDCNFPAVEVASKTTTGKLVQLAGVDAPRFHVTCFLSLQTHTFIMCKQSKSLPG